MFDKLKNLFASAPKTPVIGVDQLPSAAAGNYEAPYEFAQLNGDKFIGGFGATQLHIIDYWTLRNRSVQMFNENLYAQGLINRFITNIVNTGLTLEAKPVASILGVEQETLNKWTDDVEARFTMYCNNPQLVDYYGEKTLSQLQTQRELQALVEGDVLVVHHFDTKTNLPKIQLISSNCIQSPLDGDGGVADGHYLEHGVEFDAQGREIAYHVLKEDGEYVRYPRVGARSGRRVANLYRPGKRIMGQTRGMPLIGNVLQSLREIDRYRDSVQRKALATSFLALAVEKDADTIGAKPLASAASRSANISSNDGSYKLNLKNFNPGVFIDDMPAGHKIKMMGSDGTDLSFGDFEAAIINSVAWSKGMPPEILKMSFGSNYAASKQATAEFNMFLDSERAATTVTNDQPLYKEWLYVEAVKGNIKAPGMVEAWNDPNQYALVGAWTQSDWSGSVKLNADFVKEVQGWKLAVESTFATNEMACKALFGKKHTLIVSQLEHENAKVAQANEALGEFAEKRTQSIITTNTNDPNDTGGGSDDNDSQDKKEDSE
ncbi:coil containing protein [Vibrio phage 1.175.O._10N.261.55.B3]|nr:coil containing protein [Vibrio phage 1.175.O._10N.261.55.B3]